MDFQVTKTLSKNESNFEKITFICNPTSWSIYGQQIQGFNHFSLLGQKDNNQILSAFINIDRY